MKEALRSKFAFNGWLLLAISIPGTITVALTEARGSLDVFLRLFAISTLTLIPAILVMLSFQPLYKKGVAPWWLAFPVSGMAGALKGFLTWELVQLVGLEQPPLLSRLLGGGLSWGLVYPAVIVIGHTLLQLRDENRELRLHVATAKRSFSDLDQQLSWLVQTRVQGLSDELASHFVGLVAKLNLSGKGPGAYREIAQELRIAAQNHVRPRSYEVWNSRARPKLKELWSELIDTPANPLIASGIFLGSAVLNNLRVFGLGLEVATSLGGALAILVTLQLFQKRPLLQNLASPAAAVTALSLGLVLGQDFVYLLPGVIAAWIWSQAVLLFSVSISLAIRLAKQEQLSLKAAADITLAENNWLQIQLDSVNLEIAKYLHAILQTRLMAYAMRLDSEGQPTQLELDDLGRLLTQPLGEFGRQNLTLESGLEDLKTNWGALVTIEFNVDATSTLLTEPTLQVLREAVANAVKHGLADRVQISVADQQVNRLVTVSDNGLGPRTGRPGLGTKVFSSLSTNYSLEQNEEGGAIFSAEISLV